MFIMFIRVLVRRTLLLKFITLNVVSALPERSSKIREMQTLLQQLPVPNLQTLKYLLSHLTRCA